MSWNFNNLQGHLPGEVWESFVNHNAAAGVMIGFLFISLSYPVAHKVYMAKSEKYREKLKREQQLVVIQHTIEAVVLSLLFPPFTYLIFSANFEEQDLESFKLKTTTITTFGTIIALMYLLEVASRFANLRPLIAAHHLCAYFDLLLTLCFFTTANVRAVSLLGYFITYEALTFVGLIMYRLAPTHKLTRPTILAGMIVFGASRPFQFAWIVGIMVVNWEDLIIWQALLQLIFTLFFTTLQMYSLVIHFKLYKRCGELQKEAVGDQAYSKGKPKHNDMNTEQDLEGQHAVVNELPDETLKMSCLDDNDEDDLVVPEEHTC